MGGIQSGKGPHGLCEFLVRRGFQLVSFDDCHCEVVSDLASDPAILAPRNPLGIHPEDAPEIRATAGGFESGEEPILDTNVLLHDPDALRNFQENHVLLPIEVIEEIDKFKRETTERGRMRGR